MMPTQWQVWRQDDNGARAVMATFDSREAATACVDEFESRGHKQLYWVREVEPGEALSIPVAVEDLKLLSERISDLANPGFIDEAWE